MVGHDFTTRLLGQGLAAASLRHSVIAHNIANINTPGFKRSHVEFEEQLTAALERGQDPDSVLPAPIVDTQTVGRPDGNNVDLEGEMFRLAENQIWYAALTRQLTDHFARLQTVVSDGRR